MGYGDPAEDLEIDGWKVMIGVGIELALELRIGCGFDGFAGCVEVELAAGEAVDGWVHAMESSEHVVEGTVLHHEDDDVF